MTDRSSKDLRIAFTWPAASALGCFLLAVSCGTAANAPSILNNSNHIAGYAAMALEVLGISYTGTAGPTASVLAVNQTCAGACGSGTDFLPPAEIIRRARDVSRSEYALNSVQPVQPRVPYQVINHSQAGYTLQGHEQVNYDALQAAGIVYAMAFCGTSRATDYPPVAYATVLPNNSAAAPAGGASPQCGFGPGIEFSVRVNAAGCGVKCTWTPLPGGGAVDVSSPSSTTEALSATLAALRAHHPQWTWGDVKSVLRSTASNWRSGYTVYAPAGPGYGYGNLDYRAADTYRGLIFLQPPGLSVSTVADTAAITLFPFPTTRRAGEIVCAFRVPPVFPPAMASNEYTYAQLAAILRQYDGRIIYRSDGAHGRQTATFTATEATAYFAGFTVDNITDLPAARVSRAESFTVVAARFSPSKPSRTAAP